MDEITLKYLSNPKVKYTSKKNNPVVGFYKERVMDLTEYLLDNTIGGTLQTAFNRYIDECTLYFHNEDMLETLQCKYDKAVADASSVIIEPPTTPTIYPEPTVSSKKINHFVKVKTRNPTPFPQYQKFDDQDEKFKHKRIKDNLTTKYGDEKVQEGHLQSVEKTPKKNVLFIEISHEDKECMEQTQPEQDTHNEPRQVMDLPI